MIEIYFRGGRLKNRQTLIFYYLMVIVFLMLILLLFPGVLILTQLILEDSAKYFPIIVGVAVALGIALILLAIRYDKISTVKILGNGFLLGSRLIEWKDIDDVKFWTETYIDLEAEGSPVIGYGIYGYAMPRGVRLEKYRYVVTQIFHRRGVDELYLQSTEFWKFVKAVIRAAEYSRQISTNERWFQKFKKLEEKI
ncbi:MAG: hypothetical protein QXE67_04165 [Nitrososphaerota archaeon]